MKKLVIIASLVAVVAIMAIGVASTAFGGPVCEAIGGTGVPQDVYVPVCEALGGP